ncbi:UPF0547 protein C16orf87 homolog isoform X1 [Branchiostoma lanceolatum]|uniref:UPF0547 protein C16orf87 homolog isoform X1 n=2 Tax=Branchiostoma lanceolatum TaxID=7740 RepID=UPI003453631D
MVMKQCPACAQQIPVACKSCPCGHLFMSKRPLNPKPLLAASDVSHEGGAEGEEHMQDPDWKEGQDKPVRVKRRRSNRSCISETESFIKKVALEADRDDTNSNVSEGSGASASADQGEGAPRKKRPGRPKGTVSKNKEGNSAEKEKNAEEEMFNNLTLEQKLLYSIALADINHKLRGQRFKIPD